MAAEKNILILKGAQGSATTALGRFRVADMVGMAGKYHVTIADDTTYVCRLAMYDTKDDVDDTVATVHAQGKYVEVMRSPSDKMDFGRLEAIICIFVRHVKARDYIVKSYERYDTIDNTYHRWNMEHLLMTLRNARFVSEEETVLFNDVVTQELRRRYHTDGNVIDLFAMPDLVDFQTKTIQYIAMITLPSEKKMWLRIMPQQVGLSREEGRKVARKFNAFAVVMFTQARIPKSDVNFGNQELGDILVNCCQAIGAGM